MRRKSRILAVLGAVGLFAFSGTAMAIPTLQLDIGGGVYDPVLEDIVNTTNPFTLYGILTPDANSTISNDYILSIAISPQQTSPSDLGSFTINGNTVNVTSGMVYGTPPIVSVDPGGDLASHGIFPTYYQEFAFKFSGSNQTATYNTASNPGGPSAGTGSYFNSWVINTSGLDDDIFLHFDLYQLDTNPNNDKFGIVEFAPPSHDASSVPEASALMLFGSGLVGLVVWRRKKRFE